jgi:hypothetical protein
MQNRRTYTFLTLTGATPFVAAGVLPLLGYAEIEPFGSLAAAGLSYGLAILCFLAGVHWATFLYGIETNSGNLFVASNIIVLAVWIPYLFAPVPVVAGSMILAFLALLFIDYRLRGRGVIDDHYLAIRATATALAVISLALIAVN